MMVLKENEVCPHGLVCKYNYNGECRGADTNRPYVFTCEYIVNGKIVDGKTRLREDKTGRMRVLME